MVFSVNNFYNRSRPLNLVRRFALLDAAPEGDL